MSEQTERAILAACLNSNDWAERVWENCTPANFTGQWHLVAEACEVAWGKHRTNEPHVVQTTLLDIGYARRVSGTVVLDLYQEGEPLSDRGVDILIQRINEDAARRQVADMSRRLGLISADTSELFVEQVQALAAELATVTGTVDHRDPMRGTRTLDDLFSEEFEHNGDVIPGMFRQRTRVVLTGGEGKGKSELTFQIAMDCRPVCIRSACRRYPLAGCWSLMLRTRHPICKAGCAASGGSTRRWGRRSLGTTCGCRTRWAGTCSTRTMLGICSAW